MDEKLADKYWEVRFQSRLRDIYNTKRTIFWTGLEMFAQLGEFILSTAAFIALTSSKAQFGTWATFTVSILSFLALWLGAGKRARRCARMSKQYALLEMSVPPFYAKQTEAHAEKAFTRLRELQQQETITLPCLDMVCYRDACFEFGATPQWRLSWFERTVGRWLPIPYTPKPA